MDVQPVCHASPAIGNAEEVPLGVSAGAAIRCQPQLILLDGDLQQDMCQGPAPSAAEQRKELFNVIQLLSSVTWPR